jgi:hypothetical protein
VVKKERGIYHLLVDLTQRPVDRQLYRFTIFVMGIFVSDQCFAFGPPQYGIDFIAAWLLVNLALPAEDDHLFENIVILPAKRKAV